MRSRRVLAIVIALPALLVGTQSEATGAGLPPSEWVVGPHQKVVMLTFDGHVRAKRLRDLLETLDELNAKATFFISGHWLAHNGRTARMIVAGGHFLGNRGYGKNDNFVTMGPEATRASITRAEGVLRKLDASPRPFLRAPHGARSLATLQVAGSLGYRSVRWTVRPGGGRPLTVKRAVVRRAGRGSIVSLDLWRRSNRRAVPAIVGALRERGFRLATLRPLGHAHAIRWDVTLREGSSGPEVAYLDKRLQIGTYPVGRRDDHFEYETLQSVYAFEKANGLSRDGVVTPAELTAIAASRPRAPKRPTKTFVDIDISRQVLFEVRKGRLIRTLPISSGNEEYYTLDGQTYKAHTPRGSFSVVRKIAGWRVSRLGRLWYPSYFVGGFAIHGSESVPTYPASHGCVRIPMYATRGFYDRNPVGMPVYVHN